MGVSRSNFRVEKRADGSAPSLQARVIAADRRPAAVVIRAGNFIDVVEDRSLKNQLIVVCGANIEAFGAIRNVPAGVVYKYER